jgi:macrolide-specific efflux system membrane fusion protein
MFKSLPLKTKLSILIGVIALIGGIIYFQQKKSVSNAEITTIPLAPTTLTSEVILSGQVEQSNLISVLTKASGVVTKVHVTDGQQVKAGQKLAEITLDSEGQNNQAQAWASYLSAKKNVENSEASQYSSQATMLDQWDNYRNLAESDTYSDPNSEFRTLPEFIIYQDQWLAAEANYKTQATAIAAAKASLSQTWYNYQLYQSTITAPVDGTIIGLNLAEGLTVSGSTNSSGGASNQTVASIKTTGLPIVSFNVTEVDIAKLQTGQIVAVTLGTTEDKTYTGKLVAIDRVGSSTSGVTQYPVLVKLDQEDPSILTNMIATGTITLEKKENVLAVPASAVLDRNGTKVVRILVNGQPQPKTVETGIETDSMIEIVSGLSEGDLIITSSFTNPATSTGTGIPGLPGAGVRIPGAGMGGGLPH